MKAIRMLDDGPIGVGTRCEADVRMFGITRDRPGHHHRVRAAPPLRHQPRRDVQGSRPDHPRIGGGRHDHHRPLGGGADPADPPASRCGGDDTGTLAPSSRPTSADSRSSSRRVPSATDDTTVQLHLVDATYELFRAHFAPRPPVLGRDGIPLSGVSGLCDQLLFLLREQGATHVGCATDRVIESFRNDLFPGYKSSAGMPPELLAQFPIAEAAVDALGHRALADGRVRGRRRDRRRGLAVRGGSGRRADRRLHAGQGHGPARRRRADRALGPAS